MFLEEQYGTTEGVKEFVKNEECELEEQIRFGMTIVKAT
jgi:hypothetical protein